MPGFDKSGPTGTGAMTGGRRGSCDAVDRAIEENAYTEQYMGGRGCGRGRLLTGRYGRGFGGQGRAVSERMRATSPPDELEYLTQEAQNLERNLQTIKKRIDDLQQKSE